MNKYQIIAYILGTLSIFYLLNLKFELQRFINMSPTDSVESIIRAKKETSNKPSLSDGMLSAKMFYIASFIIGFIAIIPLLISINISNTWFTRFNLAQDSLEWTPIESTITSKGRSASTKSMQSLSSLSYYSDNVQYEYIFEGKLYQGQKLSYDNGWATSSYNDEGKLIKSLPKIGEKTTIYFNPNTGHSVMFPGRKYTNYLAIILTTPLFFIGVIIAYFSLASFVIGLAIKQ